MAFEIEEQRIDVNDLRLGMYVCRLDRPWEDTSYPLQGVGLTSPEDLAGIRAICQYVYIDLRRQVVIASPAALTRTNLSGTRFKNTVHYSDKIPVEEEAPRAHAALDNASQMVDRIYDDIASGRELSVERVEQAVRPLVASVLRSADAFFLVEGLRRHDNYSYSHSIGCSALAAVFGRHMGFAEETILSLAAGGLLMDVGKTRLPESLLRYPGSLAPAEVDVVRSHVAAGLEIVSESGITNQDVLDILRTHHERHDGSGYPDGLAGNVIPITGRMLGIIDTYDAMVSPRPYRPAISRHHALRQIYAARNTLFQAEMIERFQVCLGVYPTGSIVELSSGEVAVVIAQNQVRRLRPKIVVLTLPNKQPLKEFRQIDLMASSAKNEPIDILRGLAVGDYGVDAAELFLK
ncbi:HD-GYP domain-containing protein [Rhodanobacter sp. AS-Z3]|uniref:HD-GYP domain-containing protein n=1 Tax=Rhodanobacter sp. AS-Z3 TaxID=3031330 RepID=UPI002479DADF|nr:HD-GYP domain-containing protein [Rhodanobacter sp. AS-Z3]WEN14205.1 HD-GYP domain-containing protein [Rhodanobacter sp. AS-Z3]